MHSFKKNNSSCVIRNYLKNARNKIMKNDRIREAKIYVPIYF